MTKEDVTKIFMAGVDHGLLIAESEREDEELFDGFMGYVADKKNSMPTYPQERRHIRSEQWIKEKQKAIDIYTDYLIKICNDNPSQSLL